MATNWRLPLLGVRQVAIALLCKALLAAAQYVGGESQFEASENLEVDVKTGSNSVQDEDGIKELCLDNCVHLAWAGPILIMFLSWAWHACYNVPDWKRQTQYLQEVRQNLNIDKVGCPQDKLPHSGTYICDGPNMNKLSLLFDEDGSVSGDGEGKLGYFHIQRGKFNAESWEFVWEEVYPKESTFVQSFLHALFVAFVQGAYPLWSPIERIKHKDLTPSYSSPRSLMIVKGMPDEKGALNFTATCVCYDKYGYVASKLSKSFNAAMQYTTEPRSSMQRSRATKAGSIVGSVGKVIV